MMQTGAAPPSVDDPAIPVVPGWYDRILAVVLSVLLGFSITALPLALVDLFAVGTVVPLGAVASYTIHVFWFLDTPAAVRTSGWRPAAAAVAIAIAATVFTAINAGEHLVADTEPGITVNAARQLSVSGNLEIEAGVGPFANARVGFASNGFQGEGAGSELRSPVPHLFPALGGATGWLGIDALLLLAPILGGVLLLAFYWLAVRMVKPWMAVAITLILALSLPFALIARDAYPELLAAAFVLGGLALHWNYERRLDVNRAAIAGLLLGAAALARPEWAVLAIPVAVISALDWLEAADRDYLLRRRHQRAILAFAFAYTIPLLLAWADAVVNDVPFLEAFDARWAAGVVATVIVVYGMGRLSRVSLGTPRFGWLNLRAAAAGAIAALIVLGGLAALVFRPDAHDIEVSSEIEFIQFQEGAEIDGTRTYAEESMQWIGWYYGLAAPVLGLIGFAGMTYTAITTRDRRPYLFLLSALVVSVAFFADPGANPIHIDIIRRYLPLTIPAFLIGIGWAADRVMEVEWRFTAVSQTAVVLVLVGGAVVVAAHLRPLAMTAPHEGARAGFDELCNAIGDDAAVAVLDGEQRVMGDRITQTIRGFCNVPTARADDLTPEEALALAADWEQQGRQFVLVAPEEPSLIAAGGDPSAATVVEFDFLVVQPRVEGVPNEEVVRNARAVVTPVVG